MRRDKYLPVTLATCAVERNVYKMQFRSRQHIATYLHPQAFLYPSHATAHLSAWKEHEMLVARDDKIICVWLPATPHVSTPLRL